MATREPRARRWPRLGDLPLALWRNASFKSARDAKKAGASPTIKAEITETANVNSKTRPSRAIGVCRGRVSSGNTLANHWPNLTPARAPAAPPAVASIRLSTSS